MSQSFMLAEIFYWTLALALTASIAYHLTSICGAISFRAASKRPFQDDYFPPVSILKPVRGLDERGYECFAGFCRQNYPDYEIVFGVRDANDPAVRIIERLQKDFPDRRIKLAVNPLLIGASAKVSNLHNMLAEATHEVLAISDGDIFVQPDYLRSVVAPLQDRKVGLVTCPYRAIGGTNFAAVMETLGITGDFMLGVFTACLLEGVKFAMGSTMAMRKETLEKLGGFKAIADYLGDDYMLGHLTAKAGYSVILSPHIVETALPDYKFSGFLDHQLRWARNIRYSRPAGYVGLIFTYALPLALLMSMFFHGSAAACLLAFAALTARYAAAWFGGVVCLKDRRLRRYFHLLPARDLIGFAVWLMSFSGNTVVWRGDRFRLSEGGKLVRLEK